jgi:hypothetical protein
VSDELVELLQLVELGQRLPRARCTASNPCADCQRRLAEKYAE